MKITFIRHSKTAVKPEVPITLWGLSDVGIEKAHALSAQNEIKDLDVIYSSLQTKAIETMVYLAKPNTIPMRTHKDLTEITSFTNKFITGDEYTQQIEHYYARTLEHIAGGETIDEALARFETALETIVNNEPGATSIGVVAHGSILSFFTGKYSNLVPFDLHHSIEQPDVAEFDWESKTFTRLWGE
jgi:broad specificity phosphatase PhoE